MKQQECPQLSLKFILDPEYCFICLSTDAYTCILFLGTSSSGGENKYTIYIASNPGNYTALNGAMTLEQVNEKYWRINKPLEMFYAVQKKAESPKKSEKLEK